MAPERGQDCDLAAEHSSSAQLHRPQSVLSCVGALPPRPPKPLSCEQGRRGMINGILNKVAATLVLCGSRSSPTPLPASFPPSIHPHFRCKPAAEQPKLFQQPAMSRRVRSVRGRSLMAACPFSHSKCTEPTPTASPAISTQISTSRSRTLPTSSTVASHPSCKMLGCPTSTAKRPCSRPWNRASTSRRRAGSPGPWSVWRAQGNLIPPRRGGGSAEAGLRGTAERVQDHARGRAALSGYRGLSWMGGRPDRGIRAA